MQKIPRSVFTQEFKEEAVKMKTVAGENACCLLMTFEDGNELENDENRKGISEFAHL